MNQLGHVVLRVRYRPENLIDGIQDARHQPHVRCQAAPTQILRQARAVLFRFWVDRGAALLESATGEMTYLLLCKPHHLLFDRDGGGGDTRGERWTAEEPQILAQHPGQSMSKLESMLPNKSITQIKSKLSHVRQAYNRQAFVD
jgi:hypothetical protein